MYSSGQGLYDKIEVENAHNPTIAKDQANNFYISGNRQKDIAFNGCTFQVLIPDAPVESVSASFGKFCYPGLTTSLDSSYGNIKMRVYEEDVNTSLTINKDQSTVLP